MGTELLSHQKSLKVTFLRKALCDGTPCLLLQPHLPPASALPPSGSSASFGLLPDQVKITAMTAPFTDHLLCARQKAQGFPCLSSISLFTESITAPIL